MTLPDLPQVEMTSEAELWAWMAQNHDAGSHLLVTWKAAARDKYLNRDQVLDALVAHGWIDGRRWTHDDPARTIQLIGPRKTAVWADTYKRRAARLIAEGRMAQPGQTAYEAARKSERWEESDPVDALVVPEDLSAALQSARADSWFDAAAPSYRRNVLRFLAQAKRSETRAKRIALITDHAVRGEKVPQY